MRILVLGDLPPFVLGGAEQQLLLLSQVWREAGHDILVVGHRTPTGLHQGIPARRIGVVYRYGRLLRGLTFALSLGWRLWRVRRSFDVVYCRFLGESAIVAAFATVIGIFSTPLVVVPAAAGEGAHSDIARMRSRRTWPLVRAWLRRSVCAFNAISPEIQRELREADLGPVTTIPNGVSPPKSCISRDPSTPPDRFWLFCGRLVPQKGLDLLLEAVALAGRSDIRVLVVGEGPDEATLRAQCQRLRLTDCVSFAGRLSHRETLEAMKRAYALVLPSRYEGMSNAALEALAHGLPVLSTRCGGIDEYLKSGTGWVCEANSRSLADALSASADVAPGRWREMSRASQELIVEAFSIGACAQGHLELFRGIIADPTPTRSLH